MDRRIYPRRWIGEISKKVDRRTIREGGRRAVKGG
jgi:hypothetical protein